MVRNLSALLILVSCSEPVPEATKPADIRIYCRVDAPKECDSMFQRICPEGWVVLSDTEAVGRREVQIECKKGN